MDQAATKPPCCLKRSIVTLVTQCLLPQQGKNFSFLLFHLERLILGAMFMVVSEEVKNTVQQQKHQFMLERNPSFLRIFGSSFGADHHIAEQLRLYAAAFTFLHRKGDDIGGAIPFQIIPVDLLNFVVVDDQQ